MPQPESNEIHAQMRDEIVNRATNGLDVVCQYRRLVTAVVNQAIQYSISKAETVREFEARAWRDIGVLRAIRDQLNPEISQRQRKLQYPDKSDAEIAAMNKTRSRWIWWHKDQKSVWKCGRESPDHTEVFPVEIASLASDYLSRPWMNCREIDWILLDSMIFTEMMHFGENIKERLSHRAAHWGGEHYLSRYVSANGNLDKIEALAFKDSLRHLALRFLWLIFVPIASITLAYWNGFEKQAIWCGLTYGALTGLWVVTKLSGSALRRLRGTVNVESSLLKLRSGMAQAYDLLAGPVVNPTLARAALMSTSEAGAAWQNAALSIIDRIIAGDPAVLIVPGGMPW